MRHPLLLKQLRSSTTTGGSPTRYRYKYTNSYTKPYCYTFKNTYTDVYSISNTNTYTNTNPNTNSNKDTYTNSKQSTQTATQTQTLQNQNTRTVSPSQTVQRHCNSLDLELGQQQRLHQRYRNLNQSVAKYFEHLTRLSLSPTQTPQPRQRPTRTPVHKQLQNLLLNQRL